VRRFATTLTIGLAGAAAVATAAEAATVGITPAKPCYLSGELVTATGAGYTPGGVVDMAIDGTTVLGGPFSADAAGNFGIPLSFGTMRAVKSHALTITDETNPALTATASFLGTSNTVSVKPSRASAGTTRKLKGYGFLAGPNVYMHVRGRGYKSDTRIAKAKAPCGTFVTRKKIVPLGSRDGKYKVQFDAKRRYSKKTRPSLRGTLTVFHRLRSSSARVSLRMR
jgi:hypothetical protein